MTGSRSRLFNPRFGRWLAPPRFLLFGSASIAGAVLAKLSTDIHNAMLAGFDVGVILFVASFYTLKDTRSVDEMRQHAAANDANRVQILILAAMIMLAVLGSLAAELGAKGNPTPGATALIIVTLIASWLFTNSIFALHYAHMYYSANMDGGDFKGIDFPGDREPYYWDFIYFAFCIGMTFQTSDTSITISRVRKVVTLHAMMAFVFSIGAIAFTISVLAGGGGAAIAAAAR
jgi:uncharacterized membrane protein